MVSLTGPALIQPDTRALARGYGDGAAMREDWRENALTKYLANNGQAIMAGDRNALSGLAGMAGGLGPAMEIEGAQQGRRQEQVGMLARLVIDAETPEQFEQARSFAVRSGLVPEQEVSQYTFNDLPQLKALLAESGADYDRFLNVPGVGLVDRSRLDEFGRPALVWQTPETYRPVDVGMGYVPFGNRTGAQDGGFVPKDVRTPAAEAAAGKIEGTTSAERAAGAPEAIATAERILGQIDGVLSDPNLDRAIGPIQGRTPDIGLTGNVSDIAAKIEQLQGTAFLQAFESLKGGGQITEREGAAATAAMARLQRTQTEEGFRQALQEFRSIVMRGLDRARRGVTVTSEGDPGPAAAPSEPRGQTGQRIQGPNGEILTATPEGWADESGAIVFLPDGRPAR